MDKMGFKLLFAVCSFFFLTSYNGMSQINADFSTGEVSACNSLQTSFFDQSTSSLSIIDWSWDLGENTSQEQNPGIFFTEAGTYTICLTITDVNGNKDTECKKDLITVFPSPVVDFTLDNTEGCAPVEVTFSDNSSSANGDIVSWTWDVGGSVGVLIQTASADFASIYTIQGEYATSLSVIDEKGCTAILSRPSSILTSKLTTPIIDIQVVPSCELPWEIYFINSTMDPLITYEWDFGNGITYTGDQPPAIIYDQVGIFDLSIKMTSGDCEDLFLMNDAINTNSSVSFTYGTEPICQNAEVLFTDNSLLDAEQVIWRFGDGTTSTDTNPTHIYSQAGCYEVTLVRTASSCIDSMTLSCLDVLAQPALTYDIENQFSCLLPTEIKLHGESPNNGSFSWSFTDTNTTSHDTNDVAITITEFGLYKAELQFVADSGCTVTIDSIPVDIAPLQAHLPVEGLSGCAPLLISLTDSVSSEVAITSWEWNIPGSPQYGSSQSNPLFTIQDTGRYDVQLIAKNSYGCIDTVMVEEYLKVGNLPQVNFEGGPRESCISVPKEFVNLSEGSTDEWEWNFGGPDNIEEENPTWYFGDAGSYDVTLYASHNGCLDSLTLEDYIVVQEPVSKFKINYNCEDPYTVQIDNYSRGADSLFWTIRLSETDSLIITDSLLAPLTLPNTGLYAISHYSKGFETGCEHTATDTIRITDPIASYALDTLRGCAPFELQLGNFSQDAFIYEFVSDEANIDSIFNAEPTIIYNEGGNISSPLLIITDIHECVDSFMLADDLVINRLDAKIGFTDVICIPDVAEFTDSSEATFGNIIGWEWQINPVAFASRESSTSLYIDSIGLYDLYFKVADDWGCQDSIIITKAINAVEIIPEFTFDSLGCSWAPISFEALGDNGNVASYEWHFGDGNVSDIANPKHIYEQEGTYSVCLTMMDARGCGKTTCKENIIEISNPKASFSGNPIFATCPPLLTNFENTSDSATTYQWDFGDNSGASQSISPSHVYTSPGRFDVRLIAKSTAICSDTLTLQEYVKVEGPKGEFTADITPSCIPVNVSLNATSDGLYSYVWDLGNGILDSVSGFVIEDTIAFAYDQPGRYTPKLIVTDSIGCSRSFAGKPITVDLIELDFAIDSEILCGLPIDADIENLSTGTTEDVNYDWTIVGPSVYQATGKNPLVNIAVPGLYHVSMFTEYGACKDTLTISNFMEIGEIPEVSFEITSESFCEDVNVQFINTTTLGYGSISFWSWDFGDGNTSTEMSPIHKYSGVENRTITLTALTNSGCESTFTFKLEVLPSTVALAGSDELICIGDQIQLNGALENQQSGGQFYWSEDSSLSCTDCFDPIATPDSTTSYILVSIHPNGCESRDTIEVVVVQVSGPELTLSADSIICLGSETIIDVVNFNSDYNYQWSDSNPGQDCTVDCPQVIVAPTEASTYSVIVYNQYGCFKRDSITIEIESTIPDFLDTETAVCEGTSTTISVVGVNNPNWVQDPALDCIACPDVVITPTEDKVYYVNVKSELGCDYQDSILVSIVPEGNAYAGTDLEICKNESILLEAVGYGNPKWTNHGEVIDSNNMVKTYYPEESSTYILEMAYFECIQEDSFYVTIYEKADIIGVGDTTCLGETAELYSLGRADKFTWFMDEGEEESSSINVDNEYTTEYLVIGNYRTCITDTAYVESYKHPHIDYELEENFYIVHLNDNVTLEPSFGLERDYTFDWFPSTGLDCSDCPSPIIKGLMESTEYSLMVSDNETGCEEEQIISVRFNNECTDQVFHMPNVFSPNQDGQNDEFLMYTNNPDEFVSLEIFDRYGNKLFFENNPIVGWDGRSDGRFVQPGVYVYRVSLICPYNNEEYSILGDVTVIR